MKIENIKFRGKSKRTGEWLYGDLEYNRKKDIARIHSYDDEGEYIGQQEVDKETIGQYTGLKDRDGREIYEGDILCFRDTKGVSYLFEVVYEDGAFCFSHHGERAFTELRHHNLTKYIVNGNIHDNPELLTE